MVSSKIISNFPKSDKRITSLCDWIGRIKNKKKDFRRNTRFNQNLRVATLLTQALDRAEHEMRIKQRERAQKWANFSAEVNMQIEQNLYEEETKHQQNRKDIEEMWNGELNGLDNFMKNLSQIKTNIVRWDVIFDDEKRIYKLNGEISSGNDAHKMAATRMTHYSNTVQKVFDNVVGREGSEWERGRIRGESWL